MAILRDPIHLGSGEPVLLLHPFLCSQQVWTNVAPKIAGTGPAHGGPYGADEIATIRKALERAGWKASDLDLIEANEAFAAQACAVNKDLGWDPEIVNVNGGAIALGHPIGASGARIMATLIAALETRGAKRGLASLCIGGGEATAVAIELV